jgi:hypothetical protein
VVGQKALGFLRPTKTAALAFWLPVRESISHAPSVMATSSFASNVGPNQVDPTIFEEARRQESTAPKASHVIVTLTLVTSYVGPGYFRKPLRNDPHSDHWELR